jgi:integrase/recombinase XerD
MPRKGQRLKYRKAVWPKPQIPKPARVDPLGHLPLTHTMQEHFEWMLVSGYSEDTVRARRVAIRRFITWCEERALRTPTDSPNRSWSATSGICTTTARLMAGR